MRPPEGFTITPVRVEGNALVCEVSVTTEAALRIVAEEAVRLRGVLDARRAQIDALLAALPRCRQCASPATGRYDTDDRYCDTHRIEGNDLWCAYDWAPAVREIEGRPVTVVGLQGRR